MRDATEIINLFREAINKVMNMDEDERNELYEASRKRSNTVAAQLLDVVFKHYKKCEPNFVVGNLDNFCEACAWGLVWDPDAFDKLDGFPERYFSDDHVKEIGAYGKKLWETVQVISTMSHSREFTDALQNRLADNEIQSFQDVIHAGEWFGIDPEAAGSIWFNLCVYTPQQIKSGNYPYGSHALARELLLQDLGQ